MCRGVRVPPTLLQEIIQREGHSGSRRGASVQARKKELTVEEILKVPAGDLSQLTKAWQERYKDLCHYATEVSRWIECNCDTLSLVIYNTYIGHDNTISQKIL